MSKVACTQCGAMILPRTAAETGGICMACKQGIRASMEASREFYQQLKQYDPHRELWTWLVEKAQAGPGLGTLSEAQRIYFAVGVLEGEIYNGGLDQFFSNSSGAYYADAVAGLQALEADAALAILKDAAQILFDGTPPPVDQQERWDAMDRNAYTPDGEDAVTAQLDVLDRQFWADPDKLGERLAAFAQQSGILKPF
ncbi:MAG: hypothetical protein CFE32_22625, partial [Alphaproteobacteria bacterium PA3]